MSDTPLQDALNNLAKHPEGLEVNVGYSDGKPSGTATVTKDLPKGWSVSAAVAYLQAQWSALGSISWTPGKK